MKKKANKFTQKYLSMVLLSSSGIPPHSHTGGGGREIGKKPSLEQSTGMSAIKIITLHFIINAKGKAPMLFSFLSPFSDNPDSLKSVRMTQKHGVPSSTLRLENYSHKDPWDLK